MTAVRLSTVWLNSADDPSDRLELTLMASLEMTTTKPGEVVLGAGGRRRVIVRQGKPLSGSLSVNGADRATIAWLEAHAGTRVWVRDDRGRKTLATYFEVPVSEHAYDDCGDVSLTLEAA